MSLTDFQLPQDLQGLNYKKILKEMLATVPDQYNKIEGGFVFDMIAPNALEASELIQKYLAVAIQANFHMWATGIFLDYHAHDCGLSRREATKAYGSLQVTTTELVTFPQGFIFSVPSENSVPAIDFELLEEASVDGTETLRVRAVESGLIGNVAADSITIQKTPLRGVALITNPLPFTGGTTAEDDETLRQRIDDFYAGRSSSYVGNRRDYINWAKQIDGVGYANVICPPDLPPNQIKIVLSDLNGDGATDELCKQVEEFIFGTSHEDLNRLAPIGVAKWTVCAPTPHDISISLKPTLSLSAALVKKNIQADMKKFFKTLASSENRFGLLKYVQVSKVLAGVEGLEDFSKLRINGKLENVQFALDEMPNLAEIIFN